MEKFKDRYSAGKRLATQLANYHDHNTIALALPRGGVPVAYEIAQALGIPLDVFIVRKLGVPGHEELAMGAIASGGATYFNQAIIKQLNISAEALNEVKSSQEQELKRRDARYRQGKPFPDIYGKTVLLIDDGIATGATIRVAIKALTLQHPEKIILVVPVAASSTLADIQNEVDKIICPLKPADFYAVGAWYEQFPQTSDEEVTQLLAKANQQKTAT